MDAKGLSAFIYGVLQVLEPLRELLFVESGARVHQWDLQ